MIIINPNGVLIGNGANIDTSGLIATTADIANSAFMNSTGTYNFNIAGNPNASVINQGTITVENEGLVALVAPSVRNDGVIQGNLSKIQLGAADTFGVDLYGDGLLSLAVGSGTSSRTITAENNGSLIAAGGKVMMTAAAASGVVDSVINNTGVIQARTLVNHNGTIMLLGDMKKGQVNVSGTLDASAPNGGNGGFIETSAAHVNITNTAHITTAAPQGITGQWLIDPNDYTIAASNGDITGAAISADLNSTSITIVSSSGATAGNGDINVNDAVSWGANTTLTLSAYRNINVNSNITATGDTAGLTLTPNTGAGGGSYFLNNGAIITLSGAAPSLNIAGNAYTVINDVTALQNMNNNLAGDYALGSNIDATATSTWNAGAGFVPVGTNYGNAFTGIFDGLGNTVSNLTINPSSINTYIGLFGFMSGSTIRNVGLVNENIPPAGTFAVGGLVGYNYSGTVSNSYTTGSVSGYQTVGGLVGENDGTVINSYTTANVSSASPSEGLVGGLVGYNGSGTISNSYATGSVSGSSFVGGLVGENGGTVSNSYATGSVSGGSYYAGGLVGYNEGTVTNSYWDTITSGQSTSAGGTGLTTAQLSSALPVGFSSSLWGNVNNQTTPYLLSNPGPVYIGSDSTHLFSLVFNMMQLQGINNNLSGNYALASSLDGSNVTNWIPLGSDGAGTVLNSGNGFSGIFDGLGNTVSNMTINLPTASYYTGLFGYSSGTIRNVGIIGGTVTGIGEVAELVGYNTGSVSNSYATGTVNGAYYIGGLIGNNRSSVSNSYAAVNVNATSNDDGGLTGENAGTISNSYATGNVSGALAVGGLSGTNYGSINSSYATGNATGNGYIGGLVGYNVGTASNSYWDTDTSGNATSAIGTGLTTAQLTSALPAGFNPSVWGNVNNQTTPYLLSNPGPVYIGSDAVDLFSLVFSMTQLQAINNNLSGNYALASSLDGSSVSGWVPLGTDGAGTVLNAGNGFNGVFDGLGNTVSNLTINLPSVNYVGLFGYSSGTIRNIGLVGGSVSGNIAAGGLVGYNTGTISASYTTGDVNGSNAVGGLTGENNGAVSGSYATGDVTGSGLGTGKVGGLVGGNDGGTISNSYATGDVSGHSDIGGLTGWNYFDSSISNSYATGSVSGNYYNIGGLVGDNFGALSNSYATGSVTGNSYIGGLAGDNYGTISNSYATGSASAGSGEVGGLVGFNYYFSGTNDVGIITNSYATGDVSGNGYNGIGGLVGQNYIGATISNSYSTGSVTGVSGLYYVGGLVGFNQGTISDSYATGSVIFSGPYVGGLVGYNEGTVINSYWDTETSGQATSYGGTGLTTAQLTSVLPAGFDPSVWGNVNNQTTPYLLSNLGPVHIGSDNADLFSLVFNMAQLQGINNNLSGNYALASPLDATGVNNWVPLGTDGAGTVLNSGNGYSGVFDGLGNTVSNLTINLPSVNYVGLFGYSSGTIRNMGVIGGTVAGLYNVAELAGYNIGSVSNSYATGSVNGGGLAGGLIGNNHGSVSNSYAAVNVNATSNDDGGLTGENVGTISNSYATGNVSGALAVGGLSGTNYGSINSSYATGSATGSSYIGGLVGYNIGTVSNSYATGDVSSQDNESGGLVGWNSIGGGIITNSYATGSVSGYEEVGGLVGFSSGTISNSYATSSVSGSNSDGGLVGYNAGVITNNYATGSVSSGYYNGGLVGLNYGAISDSYATGNVGGISNVGGLVGINFGSVSNSYWDTETSGQATSAGGTGLTTAQLASALPAGFNPSVWGNFNNQTTPYLLSNPGPVYIGSDAVDLFSLVFNMTQLQGINNNLSGNYALASSLDGSSVSGWVPLGTDGAGTVLNSGNGFSGIFDGLGNTVSNLTINLPSVNYVGLFGYSSGTIRNIGMVGGSVSGADYVGELAGWSSTVSNSYATGSVDGQNTIGDLVGFDRQGTISNSYATGDVSGTSTAIGGLAGYINYGTITNSYATGNVTGDIRAVGGLLGINDHSTISNSYATGSVSGASQIGGLVGQNVGGIIDSYATGSVNGTSQVGGLVGYNDTGYVSNSYWDTETSGQAASDGGIGLTTAQLSSALPSGFSSSVWGNVNNQTTPYLLSNPGPVYIGSDAVDLFSLVFNMAQLQAINSNLSGNYALASSLDGSSISGWVPLGTDGAGTVLNAGNGFNGVFDGLGNTVSNLTINLPTVNYVGLFGYSSGIIRNIGLVGGSVSGADGVGDLAGENNGGSIANSYATGSVNGSVFGTGGLVGYNMPGSVISDSYASGNVTGYSNVGGLVGNNYSATVSGSYATGSVTGSFNAIGGLAGLNNNSGIITDSYATGNVSGSQNIGGLVGENVGTLISNSHATGNVSGANASGYGGLAGYSNGPVSNSYATGNVSGSDNVGGLMGTNDGAISNSYATGNVSGNNTVGGLVGFDNGAISVSYATGNITATGGGSGGLVGVSNIGSNITNTYATGSVYGVGSQVGGLLGTAYGNVSNSYSTGSVIGASNLVGGLVGYDPAGYISNSYWDIQTSGQATSAGGTGLTTVQLTSALPAGFDPSVWGNANNQTTPYLLSNLGPVHIGSDSVDLFSLVFNMAQLQGINNNLSGNYALASSLDASGVNNWIPLGTDGAGNVLNSGNGYSGIFDGLGNTVSNLTINLPAVNYVGLFGYSSGTIRNIGMVGGSVSGTSEVGELAGFNAGTVNNAYATGAVSGSATDAGGLVGNNVGVVSGSYATGDVNGFNTVGGLVGFDNGSISDSYATGNVTASGGGSGGLVGVSNLGTSITNSYATGNVYGVGSQVGGLLGTAYGNVSNSYSTGSVVGASNLVGGLVGYDPAGSISNSYWDTQTSGQTTSAGGTGLTTAQMMQQSSFTGWDFTNTWLIYEGHTAPLLEAFLTPLTITADNVTKAYDATSVGLANVSYSDPSAAGSPNLFGIATPYGTVAKNNVGTYNADLWSNQQGYDITVSGGQLTIIPAALTISATGVNKIYDGTTAATVTLSDNGFAGDDLVTGYGSASFADKNVGVSKTVAVAGITLGGTDAGNYTFNTTASTAANISAATITVSGITANNKTYDGTTAAALNTGAEILSGEIASDAGNLSTTETGTFTNANAGIGKTVNLSGLALTGSAAGNYVLANAGSEASTTASILAAPITVTGLSGTNRIYNGTTVDALSGTAVLNGLVAGQTLALGKTANGTLASANAGSEAVTTALTIANGTGLASNYYLVQPTLANVTISPALLTVTGLSGTKRTYNGTTVDTLSGTAVLHGLVAGQTLALANTADGTLASANAGSEAVTTDITLTNGTGLASNYLLTQPTLANVTITPALLTVTGLSGTNRTYNGTTVDALSGTAVLNGLVAGQTLALGNTADGTLASANAGSEAVTTALTIANGTGLASNYLLTQPTLANVTITPAPLTVTGLSGTNRIYNGTTVDALSGTAVLNGLVAGQTLALGKTANGTLASANAGSEAVTTALTIANGTGLASNYYLVQPTLANVTISPALLTVTGLSGTKRTYNGTTVDTLSGTAVLHGLVAGQTLALANTADGTLASANAGSEAVTTDITLTNGTGLASNYLLTQPTLANVTITPALLTVTGLSGTNRTYNGTTVDSLSGTAVLNGLVAGQTLALGNTADGTLASANAGSEAVTTALTIANGTGLASNYLLTQPTLANVTITPAPLTVTGLSGTNRTYNGTTVDALSGTAVLNGLVAGQTLALGKTADGTLASANVGSEAVTTDITIANGTGLARNYYLIQPTLANVTISPRP